MLELFKPPGKIYFYTKYDINKNIEILKSHIDSPHISLMGGYRGNSEILGVVNNNNFKIHRARQYRHPDIPYLYGTFHELKNGTQIECCFDSSKFGVLMITAIYVMSILLAIVISFFSIMNLLKGQDSLINISYILVVLTVFFFLTYGVAFAKKTTDKEISFFKEFFKNKFDAKESRDEI